MESGLDADEITRKKRLLTNCAHRAGGSWLSWYTILVSSLPALLALLALLAVSASSFLNTAVHVVLAIGHLQQGLILVTLESCICPAERLYVLWQHIQKLSPTVPGVPIEVICPNLVPIGGPLFVPYLLSTRLKCVVPLDVLLRVAVSEPIATCEAQVAGLVAGLPLVCKEPRPVPPLSSKGENNSCSDFWYCLWC